MTDTHSEAHRHECEWCKSESGKYDFRNQCCRVRFLMSQPTLEMRRGWIARMSMMYDDMTETKRLLVEQWEKRSK